jgi:hypothetical protein
MVQFPMPFGAECLMMHFAVRMLGEMLFPARGQLCLLASSCLYKLNGVLVVALCLLVGAVFGHVKRA